MPPPLPPPSTPGAPPTRAVLRSPHLHGPGEGVAIHWVHTSEMADPVPYLLGGEMLLTAGVHLGEVSGDAPAVEAYLDGYAACTVVAGSAALGFGIAPVHDTVPPA